MFAIVNFSAIHVKMFMYTLNAHFVTLDSFA